MGAGGAVKQLEGREFTFKYTSVMTLKLLSKIKPFEPYKQYPLDTECAGRGKTSKSLERNW